MNKEKEYYNEKYYMECLFYLSTEIYSMYLKSDAILIDIYYEKMCEITDEYLNHDNRNKSLLESVLDFINDEKDYILERINECVVEDKKPKGDVNKMEIGVDTKMTIRNAINELEYMIIKNKGVIDNVLYKERSTMTALGEDDIDKIDKIRYEISRLEMGITMLKGVIKDER